MPACDGREAACGGVADFQSRGIQPFEQLGFSNFEDWRAQAGDETGFTCVAEKPYKRL